MFSINCLEITATKSQWKENKSIYKNLLSDDDFTSLTTDDTPVNKRFLFNDFYKEENGCLVPNTNRFLPDNFFGENINIQAIVGKNGSGKSTLMDLMYMAINNFCYMFERGHKRERPGATELYFVPGLYLNLLFQQSKRLYVLNISNDCVELKSQANTTSIFNASLYKFDSKNQPPPKEIKDAEIASIVEYFFYTIVSNYSMQSFVDTNYRLPIYRYIDEKDSQKENIEEKYINHDRIDDFKRSWISPIFHKNDGYVRSIVLNPYRDHGVIDLANEYELSKDRVCSLFIQKRESLLHPYTFSHLKIRFYTPNSIFDKWQENYLKSLFPEQKKKISIKSETFVESIFDEKISKTIIEKFHINIDKDNLLAKYSMAYIQLKLHKIANKYREYNKFKNTLNLKYLSHETKKEGKKILNIDRIWFNANDGVEELLDKILSDYSHITKKIRRTVNFLALDNGKIPNNGILNYHNFLEKFKNTSVFYQKGNSISAQVIDDCLPPPFFEWDMFLNKYDENNEILKVKKDHLGNVYIKTTNHHYLKNGKSISAEKVPNLEIQYNQLSSGEIQFLQVISIHIYHLMNLTSIRSKENRPKYNHINLVFDELEICFHPEMQRQFLKNFISILTDLKINQNNFINIFLITHSPFILSDIPACNVLFLKDGQTVKSNRYKTFGANISDLCKDSFFLENGFVGDLAKEKTNALAKFLATKRKKDKTWNKESARNFIKNIIGETIVQNCLATLFSVKYGEEV